MIDPRWTDPNKIPLSNGPLSVTTAPNQPGIRLSADGQLIEYLLPWPMHIVDPSDWPSIHYSGGGRTLQISKPIPVLERYRLADAFGNETPDVYCSIVRVLAEAQSPQVTPEVAWSVIESLLMWIRVKARHYWLLHGFAGFGALFRGSEFIQAAGQISQRNFSTVGPNLIVRPLVRELWETLANDMSGEPPVSESIFCDGLISLVAEDDLKALLELGVACEIEITQLLREAAQTLPTTPDKNAFLTNGEWSKFKEKLDDWPQKLGLTHASAFAPKGLPNNWAEQVKELYRLRNSVAHSGKLRGPSGLVQKYIFAANALFAYCREQRRNAGIAVYSYPTSLSPSEQLVAFTDGRFSSLTSAAVATLKAD